MPEYDFGIASRPHRAFGALISLRLAEGHVLRLTQPEASSLSFALIAVRDRISPEREIYMSPIASDASFVGRVQDDGMSIETSQGTIFLDWKNVGKLALGLSEALNPGK